MSHFSHGAVSEIPVSSDHVHAFRIDGRLDDDSAEALAKHMLDVFERTEKVNMLMDLVDSEGSDWDVMFDDDVIEARFQALTNVDRYAILGASGGAARLISLLNRVIPTNSKAFSREDAAKAWEFVGAHPVPQVN